MSNEALVIRPRTSLTRNSVWMILSRFGAQGLTVVFTIVLARRLGSAGFGEYAFIAALIYVANSLTTFGTDMVLIREIAARDDLSRLPAALALQLLLSALLIAGIVLFGARIPNQSAQAMPALRIYALALIPMAFFTVFTTALRGRQRLDAYAALNAISAALLACIIVLPRIDLVSLSAFFLAVQVIMAVVAARMCAAILPSFTDAWPGLAWNMASLLKACAPFAVLTVLGMTYQRLAIYLLSSMTNASEVGLYSAAARTVEAAKMAHLAVFAALYPAMVLARNHGTQHGELAEGIRRARSLLLAGGSLAALLLYGFAGPLIGILFGSEYLASTPVLRVLAWSLIPFTVNSYLTLSLIASNREGLVGGALAASLLAALALNLWLIPAWGPAGSAWAALMAESLQSAILLVGVQLQTAAKGAARELPDLPG